MKTVGDLKKERAVKVLRGDPHIVNSLDQKIYVGDFVAHAPSGGDPGLRVGLVEEILNLGGRHVDRKIKLLVAEKRQRHVYQFGVPTANKQHWQLLSRPSQLYRCDRLIRIEPEEIEGVYKTLQDWYDERAAKKAK